MGNFRGLGVNYLFYGQGFLFLFTIVKYCYSFFIRSGYYCFKSIEVQLDVSRGAGAHAGVCKRKGSIPTRAKNMFIIIIFLAQVTRKNAALSSATQHVMRPEIVGR